MHRHHSGFLVVLMPWLIAYRYASSLPAAPGEIGLRAK